MAQFTLLGMAAHLSAIALELPMAEHKALDHASKLILDECKAEIGTYQGAAGPFPAWAPLAPSTLEKKAADTPGLETGEMRDSYERTVVDGHNAYVGSNNDKALWFELGTKKQPPRSVIGTAAVHKEHQIHEDTGRYFYGILKSQNAGAIKTLKPNP